MRVSVAIDRFLEQMELERDWTHRSVHSYQRVLVRLCDDPPRGLGAEVKLDDFDSPTAVEKLREHIGRNWGKTSSGRRANVISIHHTFWGWAVDESLIDHDPSARIRRPPRRRPDIYRPPIADQELAFNATTLAERAAWILMNDVALRASTVVSVRWQDVDLTRGRISVKVKGGHRLALPLSPSALARLRDVYRQVQADLDDYVFVVERPRFVGNRGVERVRDPKRGASTKSLWMMVGRVCDRAGVKRFGPHALRHGFATRFLRESGHDIVSLQRLLGHASIETTRAYFDELRLDELDEVLRRVSEGRTSVAQSGDADPSDVHEDELASSGPGWNRTTGPGQPADVAEGKRAGRPAASPETDEKECH